MFIFFTNFCTDCILIERRNILSILWLLAWRTEVIFVSVESIEFGSKVFQGLCCNIPHFLLVKSWTWSLSVVYVICHLVHGSKPWQHHLPHDQSAYEERLSVSSCCWLFCVCHCAVLAVVAVGHSWIQTLNMCVMCCMWHCTYVES